MVSFHIYDFIVIAVFFALLLYAGLKLTGGTQSDDYSFGGQKLTLIPFIMTNVATWYGGILGVGEYTYRYGVSSWFTQGLPYYLFAILFALFFAGKIRSGGEFTIPEFIRSKYGDRPGRLSALLVFFLVSPAPYLLMSAKIISLVFSLPLFPSLLISAALCMAYLLPYGFRSDVGADMFLFLVMFIGFIATVIIAFLNFGGSNYLIQNLPPEHLTLTGGLPVTVVIVWWLIGLWTFIDPGFFQRTKAAANPAVARKGILLSIFFWFLFDFLTTTTGLYARASLPNLSDPSQSYLLLAEAILGPGMKGLFYAALLATILSTLNSFLFLSGVTLAGDVFKGKFERSNPQTLIRLGMLVASLISIVICLLIPSVIEIWFTLGSYFVPGLIFLLAHGYLSTTSFNEKEATTLIIVPSIASIVWDVLRKNNLISPEAGMIEPMFLGLTAGTILLLMYRALKNRR